MVYLAGHGIYQRQFYSSHSLTPLGLGMMESTTESEPDALVSSRSSIADILNSRTAKVAPAGEPQQPRPTQPLKKKLEFINARIKKFTIDEEDIEIEIDRTSCGAKIFFLLLSCGSFALGVGLTYYGAFKNLRDFLVLGIGCIIISVVIMVIWLVIFFRERYFTNKIKRSSSADHESNGSEQVEQLRQQESQYFLPLGDMSKDAIKNQRRPSNAELYGQTPAERTVNQISEMRKMRAVSAGLRSDGVLTASGIDVDDDSRMCSPPLIYHAQSGALDPDKGLPGGSEDDPVSSSGVYATKLDASAAHKNFKVDSLKDLKLDSETIKREITDMYREPSSHEKTLAAVEKSLSDLE